MGFSLQWLLLRGTGPRARGLRSCSPWAPEHRLSSSVTRASLPSGMWVFPGQRSNPRLPYRQADSLPLSHQGSPWLSLICCLFRAEVYPSSLLLLLMPSSLASPTSCPLAELLSTSKWYTGRATSESGGIQVKRVPHPLVIDLSGKRHDPRIRTWAFY